MTQTTAPVLFAPFLLATDGSPSAHLAQKLLTTIAQSVQAQQNGNGRSLVTVLTVEPRRSSRSKRLTPPHRSKPAIASDVNQETVPSAALSEATGLDEVALDAVALDITEAAVQLSPPEDVPALEDMPKPEGVSKLEDYAAAIQTGFPAALPVSVQVRQGRPAIEILNCAHTLRAGLIALGSRGTSGMRGRLMGSVSAVIARYAPCSVLVARGAVSPEREPGLHHLLLVVDDSPSTQAAIATTRQLLPAGVQQVTILYAQSPLNADYLFGPFATPTPSWQLNQSLQEAQNEQSEQILQHAKAAFDLPNVTVSTLRQTGEAGPLICQIAQQRQVDLIVLGGHLMRRWLRLSPGDALLPLQSFRRSKPANVDLVKPPPALRNTRLSAAEDYTLHHAPCPVLLCRASQTAPNNG